MELFSKLLVIVDFFVVAHIMGHNVQALKGLGKELPLPM